MITVCLLLLLASPVPVASPTAVYPAVAKSARIRGTVTIRVEVLPDGSPGEMSVVKGVAGLNRAALDATALWRFEPHSEEKNPTVDLEFKFELPRPTGDAGSATVTWAPK